jgi:tetratricopeptide (TPR) repeat protein
MAQLDTGTLELDVREQIVIRRAMLAHHHAKHYVELVLRKRLGEGRSAARVIEAEWRSAGRGTNARSVLKIDEATRLTREARFSREHGHLSKLFMRVVACSFDDQEASPEGLGCIIYEHPEGDFPGEFTSLEERCRTALVNGAPLDEIVKLVGDTVAAVTKLQAGSQGRRVGSGIEQLAFYLGAWAPAAVVEVKQLERNSGNTLRLFLADEPHGLALEPGSNPAADQRHIGEVVEFAADELYADASRTFVNLSGRFAVEIKGIEPARVCRAAKEIVADKLMIEVRGRLLDTSLARYQARVRDLGLEPDRTRLVVADLEFQNPLADWAERVRRWASREPGPEFVLGHGDLHAGNVLCSSQLPVIIDHAWYGERLPCWADTARLIGSLWLNAIAPELTLEEVAQAIFRAFRAPHLPCSDRAAWAASFLMEVVAAALQRGPQTATAARELWIDLHHFAWIGLKWNAKPAAHLAMLMLAAVAIEEVESQGQAIVMRRELSGALVGGSGKAVLGGIPTLVDDAFGLAREHDDSPEQELQRSLYYEIQEVLGGALEAMEVKAPQGMGAIADLLDNAVLRTWRPIHSEEAGKLRDSELAQDPRDRVVLADALFFACATEHSEEALVQLINLASDGDLMVEAEVALLMSCLLSLPEVWEFLDRTPRIARRLQKCLNDLEFAERLMAADRQRWARKEWPSMPRLDKFEIPRALHLRPFDPQTDVPPEIRVQADDDVWTLLGDIASLSDGEKRGMVAVWSSLSPWQRSELRRIFANEVERLASLGEPIQSRAAQRALTLSRFVSHINLKSDQRVLLDRRDSLSRSFAELVSDKSLANRAVAHHEARRAHALVDAGQRVESLAVFERADRLFVTAQQLSPLGEDDQVAWARVCVVWGDQLGQLASLCEDAEKARQLRREACTKYEQAQAQRSNEFKTFFSWGYELGELASLSKDAEDVRRLRKEACEKYEQALAQRPNDSRALFNWGYQLGALAILSKDAEEARRLRKEACEKYEQVLAHQPKDYRALSSWGYQLGELAILSKDVEEARRLRKEACEKYEHALAQQPNYTNALFSWGYQLGELTSLSEDAEEARRLRKEACEKYEQALAQRPNEPEVLYNLAQELMGLAHLSVRHSELWCRYLEQCDEVLRRRAQELGISVTQQYNYACLLVLRDQREQALDSLAENLRAGKITAEFVREDADWRSFHEDPRWRMLVGLADEPAVEL